MRIDVLEPLGSQYQVLHHFSRKLFEAMQRKGINCRYIPAQHGSVHLNWKDLPDCTLGFNGVPCSGENKEMLCDQIATPHLAILVDPPTWHYPLTTSPFTILTCDDRSGNRFLDLIPFKRHFFLPHAVEQDIVYNPHEEKIYDVTLLATFINYEERHRRWQGLFPKEVCAVMDETIAITFSEPSKGFLETFKEILLSRVPSAKDFDLARDPNFLMLSLEIELYIKGKERLDLIRSLKTPNVHIFGASIDVNDWKKELEKQPNVHFHPPVSFDKAFEVMRKSKVLLNSSMKNKEGAHERIFMGLGSGAAVVTNDCPFIREEFEVGEEILLYNPPEIELLNGQLSSLLKNPKRLNAIIQSGRSRVMSAHTWDHRVDTILDQLPAILATMPSTH